MTKVIYMYMYNVIHCLKHSLVVLRTLECLRLPVSSYMYRSTHNELACIEQYLVDLLASDSNVWHEGMLSHMYTKYPWSVLHILYLGTNLMEHVQTPSTFRTGASIQTEVLAYQTAFATALNLLELSSMEADDEREVENLLRPPEDVRWRMMRLGLWKNKGNHNY